MTKAIRIELQNALLDAETDDAVKAVMLYGAHGDFSAGGDLQRLMQVAPSDFRAYLAAGHETVRAFWRFPKPAVAAIDGVAVGGGLALALCCDQIIAAKRAQLGFTFAKIGLLPDWGTLFTLPRRVGAAQAQSLFLTGRLVDGKRAHQIGLVDSCVGDSSLLGAARETALGLAALDAETFALTKRAVRSLEDRLDMVLEFELQAQQSRFKSPAFFDGVAPFLGR